MKTQSSFSRAEFTRKIEETVKEMGLKVLPIQRTDPLVKFIQVPEGYVAIGTTDNQELRALAAVTGCPNATHIVFCRDDYAATNETLGLECVKRLIEKGWSTCPKCNSSCFAGRNCISCGELFCHSCIALVQRSKGPCPCCGGKLLNL